MRKTEKGKEHEHTRREKEVAPVSAVLLFLLTHTHTVKPAKGSMDPSAFTPVFLLPHSHTRGIGSLMQ